MCVRVLFSRVLSKRASRASFLSLVCVCGQKLGFDPKFGVCACLSLWIFAPLHHTSRRSIKCASCLLLEEEKEEGGGDRSEGEGCG